MNNEKILKNLIDIVGKENVFFDGEIKQKYSFDMTENEPHQPDFVVMPKNLNEIINIVFLANKEKFPITPMVAGTNLGGLTIPVEGGIILDLKRMNKIIDVNENEMYAIIEPGVTFGDMKNFLDENHKDLIFGYPLSPPHTSVVCNCLLDGLSNLSNKYGVMSDWINGIEVVLPNGDKMMCGSCALSKYWFSRAPMPDLTGLFISWQGTTGIVTKMAVQLWPKPKYRKRMFLLSYDIDTTYNIIRKFSRTGIFDDIGGLSWPTAKMLLGVKKPKTKDPNEPEFFIYLDISSDTKAEMKLKQDFIKNFLKKTKIEKPLDVELLIKLNPEFAKLSEFPTTLNFLLDHGGGGLTWIGSYGPTNVWKEAVRCGFKIMSKNDFPPLVVTRPMRGGHFGVLRFIMIFDKTNKEELERI
jgi:glycolate oxidase